MRHSRKTRVGSLALAIWFGGLYCILGCEMGFTAKAMPAQAHHHATATDHGKAVDDCGDGCCKKPAQKSHHKSHNADMKCCQPASTVAITKAKPPKLAAMGSLIVSSEVGRNIAATQVLQPEPIQIDFGETYLRLRILRI